jgi:hypothetical protein
MVVGIGFLAKSVKPSALPLSMSMGERGPPIKKLEPGETPEYPKGDKEC